VKSALEGETDVDGSSGYLSNHEVKHGSPRRFGLVGWPRPSDVGFETSMERFIAQTSDQTILMN